MIRALEKNNLLCRNNGTTWAIENFPSSLSNLRPNITNYIQAIKFRDAGMSNFLVKTTICVVGIICPPPKLKLGLLIC